jgi:hypothetical protein
VHLAPLKLEDAKTIDQYAEHIATLTPGMSGADLQVRESWRCCLFRSFLLWCFVL